MKTTRNPLDPRAVVLFLWLSLGACGDALPPEEREKPEQPDLPPSARPELLEELRFAHEAPRSAADGGGSAHLVLPAGDDGSVVAGTLGRWTIEYEAGPEGIAPGGFIRLTVPRFWGWSPAQDRFPNGPGYTVATTEATGVSLETRLAPGFWIDFLVRGRRLEAGERVRIVYGAGSARAIADRFAEHDSRFWISVDGDGDGIGAVLPDSPGVHVLAGPPAIVRAILPSTAEPGDRVELHLSVLDAMGNRGTGFVGEVLLRSDPPGLELPDKITIHEGDNGVLVVPFSIEKPGIWRVHASATLGAGPFDARSNPLHVAKGVAPVLWADLHGHSNLSDGTGTPDDYLSYARDVAALDVICLTDHDHWGMLFLDEHPELWRSIQDAMERFHEPHSFVTLIGYEWTNWIYGHRHVLYFEETGPLFSSIDPRYETPTQLWNSLAGHRALTFAHHSAGGPIATDWSFSPDPRFETVTEIVSVHGNSESRDAPYPIPDPVPGNTVRDALGRGYRLGFIGSGDSHDGHPGLAQIASPSGGGLAAILTDDLTRDGIYRALRARRVYATNGPRILLRMAVDDTRMGGIHAPSKPGETPTLFVQCIAAAPLAGIDVVRNGKVITGIQGGGELEFAATLELDPLEEGDTVFVRAIQLNRGAAWSSPVFVGEEE
ncbi:MAG TPA: DUF3604 domain-containing protein [Planctomycetes bacterium]|nr:DUF3604 domain-containing protein [Planctomycetota bacterium]